MIALSVQMCFQERKCSIYTKEALTKGQILNAAMEEYLKKRMLSIILCTNWVRAGTFVDHEWVSESTISQHLEEVMGMVLDHKIGIPCMVHWCMLWFSAPTSRTEHWKDKIRKLCSTTKLFVNMAITDAISRPFGSCMLALVATVLHRTHRKWEVNKEMEGWSLELLPFADDDDSDESKDA